MGKGATAPSGFDACRTKNRGSSALARVRGIDPFHRTESDPAQNNMQGTRILGGLADLDYGSLSERNRQALVRTYQVVLNRFRGSETQLAKKIINQLDPHFPADNQELYSFGSGKPAGHSGGHRGPPLTGEMDLRDQLDLL